MLTHTIRLLVGLSLFNASFALSAGQAATDLQSIVERANELSERYSSRLRGEPLNVRGDEIVELDKDLAVAVVGLIRRYSDISAAEEASRGSLVWREFPRNVTHVSRVKYQLDRTKAIFVNYRLYDGISGRRLLVLENSFWATGSRNRIQPSMYNIMYEEGADPSPITYITVPIPKSVMGRFAALPPCFLGFLPGAAEMPRVVMLRGPAGSGSFAHVDVFSFNDDSNRWKSTTVLELSRLGMYSYDEISGVLKFEETQGGKLASHELSIMELFADVERERPASSATEGP